MKVGCCRLDFCGYIYCIMQWCMWNHSTLGGYDYVNVFITLRYIYPIPGHLVVYVRSSSVDAKFALLMVSCVLK